jgi:structural maintenance of chromosome 2
MRPAEILGLVEEAAGTRMFEERKAKALKTMAKKASRIDSITSVLREEIVPKLDALRAERAALLLWRKACAEAERVGRVLRAWEWTEARERTARKGAEIEKREREIARVKKDRERFIREGEAAERDAQEIQRRREDELRKGNKLKKGEEEVAELDKALVKIRTQVDIKNASINDEDAKISALQAELKEVNLVPYLSFR